MCDLCQWPLTKRLLVADLTLTFLGYRNRRKISATWHYKRNQLRFKHSQIEKFTNSRTLCLISWINACDPFICSSIFYSDTDQDQLKFNFITD